MSMKRRILEVLEAAPATSSDIAAELQIRARLASSYLSTLERLGCIKSLSKLPSTGGRPQKLYATLETPT